jgi:hypothetical protein
MADEARLARRELREGRFQRSMALVAAFAAIVSGFEAYVQHLRGAFAHWLMWTPVALTPPMVLASAAALISKRAARVLLPVASLAALVDGVVGFFFHLRGIARMPGGLHVGQYNVVMGPPVFAPLLMSIVGVLGLLATSLRRERKENLDFAPEPAFGVRIWDFTLKLPKRKSQIPNLKYEISHGQFQRGMALISAVLAILAGGEAYFEHLRGSYNQRVMWTPVWVTPPMVAAAIGAVKSERVAHRILPFAAAVTFLDGMLGFLLHLRGIKRMPGGFDNLDSNIPMGPPAFAPLLFSAVGLLGFIAVLLRRQEKTSRIRKMDGYSRPLSRF